MTNIIRIEHEDGWGIFRWNDVAGIRYTIGDGHETQRMYELHSKRLPPWKDGIDFDYNTMFCAFDSLETFNALVEAEEVKFLLTKGFKVLLLEVSEVYVGSQQVCYKKEHIINTKDISSLF